MAVASLVLGIVSILLSFWGWTAIGGMITGIIGLVLAVKARKEEPSGIATGGLVTSIIGTAISGIIFLSCVVCVGGLSCLAKKAVDDPAFKQGIEEAMEKAAKEASKDPNFKKSMDELTKGLKELEKKSGQQ